MSELLCLSQMDTFFASMMIASMTPVAIHSNPVTKALVGNTARSITRPNIIVITEKKKNSQRLGVVVFRFVYICGCMKAIGNSSNCGHWKMNSTFSGECKYLIII